MEDEKGPESLMAARKGKCALLNGAVPRANT